METKKSPGEDKVTITITVPKALLSLLNFWPALLVGLALLLSLPKTMPVLKEIPERLVLTEADAARKSRPCPIRNRRRKRRRPSPTPAGPIRTAFTKGLPAATAVTSPCR